MKRLPDRRLTLIKLHDGSLWNNLLPHLEKVGSLRIKLWVIELLQRGIESELQYA